MLGAPGLRLIEEQPNRLGSGDSRTPTQSFYQDQGRLYREILLFRGDLDRGCALKV
jgi:hypothetical protein